VQLAAQAAVEQWDQLPIQVVQQVEQRKVILAA
jgi:hypothetical protein